jgi:hypothetical protein
VGPLCCSAVLLEAFVVSLVPIPSSVVAVGASSLFLVFFSGGGPSSSCPSKIIWISFNLWKI